MDYQITFARMKSLLESVGLKEYPNEACRLFSTPQGVLNMPGEPLIAFRKYEDDEVVRPIDMLYAKRHLWNYGLTNEEEFGRFYGVPDTV